MEAPNTSSFDPDKPPYDKERLHELASAALDGTANESQLQDLTDLLRENSVARDEYLKLMDLHAVLSTQLVDSPSPRSVSRGQSKEKVKPQVRRRTVIAVVISLAACLLFAVNLFRPGDTKVETVAFASIAQETNVIWDSEELSLGQRLSATTLRLRSGIVRLEFDSGVEVTLKGPAEFKLLNESRTQLSKGLLTATVPPGAEGFTVDTPSAQVIDLGTSFGIDISNEGFSNVTVFDGEVEVAPHQSAETRLLSEGESVRIGTDYEVEDIALDPKPFERMWPTASGIAGSSESIKLVPPWPKQIRFIQSDDNIFVRAEGPPTRLRAELKVNVSEPSRCSGVEDLTPATLQTDEFVRSYILHYSPVSQLGRRRAQRVTGSITFASPVLGLITKHEELVATSRRFGRRGAGEINQRRELNLTNDEAGDRIALSEDRMTVTLDLVAPGRSSDLVRVIVEGRRRPDRMRQPNGNN